MTALDIILGGWLAVGGILGLVKGFSRQIYGWTVWLLGLYVVYTYTQSLAHHRWVSQWIAHPTLRPFVVACVLLFVVLLISWTGQWLLKRLIQLLGMGVVDALLGFILGLLQALMIAWIASYVLEMMGLSLDDWRKTSRLWQGLDALLPHVWLTEGAAWLMQWEQVQALTQWLQWVDD